jgi:hypothetical protein
VRRGRVRVPLPEATVAVPLRPLTEWVVGWKFERSRASLTMNRLAPESMRYGILSVSATNNSGEVFRDESGGSRGGAGDGKWLRS